MTERRTVFRISFLIVLAIAALLRIPSTLNPGLWVDEIFSLAIATGHSLEHPAHNAVADFGDYVEPDEPARAATFARYLEHESPPAGPARVVRSVKMSDTNPPLYYVAINAWTRLVGTSDVALRSFSLLCALACFPLLWAIGKGIADERAAWTAILLFACSPRAIYYSSEGRMYSLLWLLALALALLALELNRRGPRPFLLLSSLLVGTAGLMTHYFFVFVALACLFWLLLYPGRLLRWQALAIGAVPVLAVAPWYVQVPDTINAWRVTAGWLDQPLTLKETIVAPLLMGWSFVSGSGVWQSPLFAEFILVALYVSLIIAVCRKGLAELLSANHRLIWAWVLAACFGPLVFDLLRGTNASLIARYALPGLPAGLLLVAIGASRLSTRYNAIFVVFVLLAWAPGIQGTFAEPSRRWQPYPEIAADLDSSVSKDDLILIHSIPGGVLGVARYLESSTPIASRVIRLHERDTNTDMNQLTADRCRIALVRVHDLDDPAPEKTWLDDHADLEREIMFSEAPLAEIRYYRLNRADERYESHCPR